MKAKLTRIEHETQQLCNVNMKYMKSVSFGINIPCNIFRQEVKIGYFEY